MNSPTKDCRTCASISGERRISPGPTIAEGRYWLVEHAYPCAMKGWLVLVLKRHAEALHELTSEEFSELALLLEKSAKVLSHTLDCEKEYAMCFAEAEGFHHIHIHVVPKPRDLPVGLKGPAIFAMLKVTEEEALPGEEIKQFCEELQREYAFDFLTQL